MSPCLSVVIPAYNVADFIVAAVRSALGQTWRDLEVIVVDDGSPDDTVSRLADIDDPRLCIVRQENRGLAGARNAGVLAARGQFLGFLDGDDLWYPQKAERQLAVMQAEPQIGITFSHSAYIDVDGRETGQLLTSRLSEPNLRNMILRNETGNGSTPIVRRECFEIAGLFNEAIRNGDEQEMWVRVLHRTPYRMRLVPEVLTAYRIRPGSLTLDFEHFLLHTGAIVDIFEASIPGLSHRLLRRARAETYRIAARKALAAEQTEAAQRYTGQALRLCPWLPLVDARAAGTLGIVMAQMLLPERWQRLPYRAVQGLLARRQRRLNRTEAV